MDSVALARRSRALWWAGLALLVVAGIALGQNPRRVIDLKVYLLAAERFLEGSDLYRAADGAMPFKYPPAAAAFFIPWALLPVRVAGVVWNLGSVVALAASASLLLRRTTTRNSALFASLLVLAHPLMLELHYGQVDLWMLLLLVYALHGATEGATLRPGLAVAIAVLLKPPALLIVLLLLVERRYRVLGAALGFGALLWAPVLLRYGVDGTWAQVQAWRALLEETTAPWALGHNPQGLPTVLLQLVHTSDALPSGREMAIAQLVAALLALGAVWAWKPDRETRIDLAIAAVALLSPLAWRANLVLAFPLVVRAASSPTRSGRALVVVAGVIGAVTTEWLLQPERFQAVMLWRPFAIAYAALAIWALAVSASTEEAASPMPQTK